MRQVETPAGGPDDRPVDGPQHPPYPGPFDIPVLVDDVKRLEGFEMARCTYFTVEAAAAVDDWVAGLRARGSPFLILGISPVLHRPDLEEARFQSAEQVDRLFSAIEEVEGLLVETAHIWLPNFLLPGGSRERGEILRVAFGLFQKALLFQQELIGPERFLEECRELLESEYAAVEPSPGETAAFRDWSAAQLDEARRHYAEQRADPERGVLEWRDERGVAHAG